MKMFLHLCLNPWLKLEASYLRNRARQIVTMNHLQKTTHGDSPTVTWAMASRHRPT